jgi:raffinose/stachyose/melibiose transport system permease protein
MANYTPTVPGSTRSRIPVGRILLYTFLVVFAFLQIFPLLWLLNYSLTANTKLFGPDLISLPSPPRWDNYVRAFVDGRIPRYFANSAIIVSVSVLVTSFFAFTISYACARMQWKRRRLVFNVVLLGMVIPIHTTLLPNFQWFKLFGLIDTHLGVIIAYIAFNVSFSTLMFSGLIASIPRSMEESAYMDGARMPRILAQVIAPMAKAGFVTVGVMTFLNTWNEFIMANTYLATEAKRTLPFSIIRFQGQYSADYAVQFAVMMLVAVPAVLLFFVFSKYVIAGVTAGSVKE